MPYTFISARNLIVLVEASIVLSCSFSAAISSNLHYNYCGYSNFARQCFVKTHFACSIYTDLSRINVFVNIKKLISEYVMIYSNVIEAVVKLNISQAPRIAPHIKFKMALKHVSAELFCVNGLKSIHIWILNPSRRPLFNVKDRPLMMRRGLCVNTVLLWDVHEIKLL